MQGEKAPSFSTRGGYAKHDEPDGGTRHRNETEEDGFARAERRMRCRFYASPSHSYLLRYKQKYGTRAYPLFREHAVIIVAEYRALTSNASNAFDEGLQSVACIGNAQSVVSAACGRIHTRLMVTYVCREGV